MFYKCGCEGSAYRCTIHGRGEESTEQRRNREETWKSMSDKQWKSLKYFTIDEKYGPEDRDKPNPWGDPDKMDFFLLRALDKLRERIGKPFIIHCGYELEGHAPNSYHAREFILPDGSKERRGQAVDFHIEGKILGAAWEALNELWWFGGMGIYPYWNNPGFHLDIGPYRRWRRKEDGEYEGLNDKGFAI